MERILNSAESQASCFPPLSVFMLSYANHLLHVESLNLLLVRNQTSIFPKRLTYCIDVPDNI